MLFGLGDGPAVDISFNDVVLRKHVLHSDKLIEVFR